MISPRIALLLGLCLFSLPHAVADGADGEGCCGPSWVREGPEAWARAILATVEEHTPCVYTAPPGIGDC